MVTIACHLSTPVACPPGANDDGVCAIVLGSADGKAYSKAGGQMNQAPQGRGRVASFIYVCSHTVKKDGM